MREGMGRWTPVLAHDDLGTSYCPPIPTPTEPVVNLGSILLAGYHVSEYFLNSSDNSQGS